MTSYNVSFFVSLYISLLSSPLPFLISSVLSIGTVEGFADDYAFMVRALIDLYEASYEPKWLEWAHELQEQQDNLFLDKGGGYFSTSGKDDSILLQMKEGKT